MKKVKTGRVVSDRMTQTIVVKVEEHRMHPRYRKHIRQHFKFHAHDPAQRGGHWRPGANRGVQAAQPHEAVAVDRDR